MVQEILVSHYSRPTGPGKWQPEGPVRALQVPHSGQVQGCRGQQAPVLASQALRIGDVDVGPGPLWRLPSPPREGSGIVDATGLDLPGTGVADFALGAGLLQQRAQGKVLAASVRGGRHWVSVIPSLPARLEKVAQTRQPLGVLHRYFIRQHF